MIVAPLEWLIQLELVVLLCVSTAVLLASVTSLKIDAISGA